MRNGTFILSDNWYDFLKKMIQIIMPAFGTLYFALAKIWDLPYADKVTGTIVCVTAFLGVVLGISTAQYNASGKAFDGRLTVEPSEEVGTRVTGLHLDKAPIELAGKSSIKIKVENVVPDISELVDEDEEPEPPPQNPATNRRKRQ
jgi:hypothetical protein